MNDVLDPEVLRRLRVRYGGPVQPADITSIRTRARHLERRRRRRTLVTAIAIVGLSASALTLTLISTDDSDSAQLSTEIAPSSSISASTSITTTSRVEVAQRENSVVKVLVANGSGQPGYATQMNQGLTLLGYSTLGPENARPVAMPTVIYFRPTYAEEAKTLAHTIGASLDLVQPMPSSLADRLAAAAANRAAEAHIVIILGNEESHFTPTSSTTAPSAIISRRSG